LRTFSFFLFLPSCSFLISNSVSSSFLTSLFPFFLMACFVQ
jgi:hypothetical protein